jgi:hypothetical protein
MAHSGAFGIRVISRAPPQVVYRLLADATLWKTWAGPLITRSEWEVEPGDGDGGIRRLGRAPFMVREEITAADPPHHHGYRLLSGQPVRSYTADVYISPIGDPVRSAVIEARDSGASPGDVPGSHIEWTGTVVPLVPGTGRLMDLMLGRMVRGFAWRLAAAAEWS